MYHTYRLTLRPLTSFRTPLQSDTIFGHLLWALRYLEGESALAGFLDSYREGQPPLLLSAAFPAGYLPVPLLPPPPLAPPSAAIADVVVQKLLHTGSPWLPLAQWRDLVNGLTPAAVSAAAALGDPEPARATRVVRTRTAVDRLTGSAREGRLFNAEESFFTPGATFEIWHRLLAEDSALPGRLEQWWRWIAANGFGRRKSEGRGAFEIVGAGLEPAADALPEATAPNGFMTLSAWVPREGDPTDVSYQTRIKRGKLAEAYALPSPWKKPLLMFAPGATARLAADDALRPWYGGLVEEMHWTRPGMVQYGYALPLPVRLT